MTTPKRTSGGQGASGKAAEAKPHMARPEPPRDRPNKTGKKGKDANAPPDHTVSESVSHAVKVGYDVIAENIRQGREAAARFRQGEYNVREVPGDLQDMALRLITLARELSKTTLDVCERLLKEVADSPEDRTKKVAPFPNAVPSAQKPSAPSADTGVMKVTIRFTGGGKGIARTATLSRPRRPTAPDQISVTPLSRRAAGAKPIGGVSFETDMSVEGIVAVVNIPKKQEPGIYSGQVYAKGDEVPLGVLTIEVPK
jgi:hypothetical protein